MESFRAIRAYLAGVRRRLRRQDALRALVHLGTFTILAGLAGVVLSALVRPRHAALFSRTLAGLEALGVLVFVVAGIVVPRFRLRRDPEVARHVGAAAPPIASDL